MNVILTVNTVLAILTLFASAAFVTGWILRRLLKRIALLLQPLVKDDEKPAPRIRETAQAARR